MSVKLDGIDLNSVVDSIDANDEAGLDNRLENETLAKNYGDPGDVGGVSLDVARVLGEGNGTLNVRGSINRVLNGEMGAVDRNWSWEAESVSLNAESELKGENMENQEGAIGVEAQKDDGNLCLELNRFGIGEAERMAERSQSHGWGVNALPQNVPVGEKVGLLFDLNARQNSHSDIISDNPFNGTAGGNEYLIESNLPVAVGLVSGMATTTEAVANGNPNYLNEDKIINVTAEDLDGQDFKHAALIPKVRGIENQTEKEGEYYVSDLVWGKVRSHPWWPGQIFEPSTASKKAFEHIKKDSYLIAYFGDQTFAWNEASKIKPFHKYFSQMEKQSKAETFSHAVDSALNEVSRRIEFGLACRCLKEEVIASVSSQVVVSSGIQEQSRRMCGTDTSSTAGSFFPENLVNYLKSLAEAPRAAIDRLEFVKARAQFLAYNRWKGYLQLPVFEEFDYVLENEADPCGLQTNGMMRGVITCNEDDQVLSGKAMFPAQMSSQKRKYIAKDDRCKKRKKYIMELVHGGSPSLPNGEKKYEGKASRKLPSSRGKRKVDDAILNESGAKRIKGSSPQQARSETSSLPREHIEVGEHLFGVAGKLDGSALSPESCSIDRAAVEHGGRSFNSSSSGISTISKGKSLKGRSGPQEFPPTDEMLSKLVIAAKNPIEDYGLLVSTAGFFSDFRKYICMEYNSPQQKNKLLGRQKAEKSCELENTGTFEFQGMEDSYWTDRIIESRLDESVLFEPETYERVNPDTVNYHRNNTMVAELDVGNQSHVVDDKFNDYSPTALILNFTSLDSVPPITNLNEIFSRYGALDASETKVLSKSKRAKVVFIRRSDAETAFSSTGKFSIFGPSLVSYRLKYSPTPCKTSTASKLKGRRKKSMSTEEAAT